MGYDQPRELYGSAGGKWCAPVWRSFMINTLQLWKNRQPVKQLIEDARATSQRKLIADQYKQFVRVRICDDSGMLATRACPHTHIEEFSAAAGAPTNYCDIHKGAAPDDASPAGPDSSPPADNDGGNGDNLQNLPADQDPDTPVRHSKPAPDLNGAARRQYYKDSQQDQQGGGTGAATQPDNGTILNDDPDAERAAQPQAQPQSFTPPVRQGGGGTEREVVLTICMDSGDIAGKNCPVRAQQTFLASQAPRRICRLHTN
jgi:hypothetical protein